MGIYFDSCVRASNMRARDRAVGVIAAGGIADGRGIAAAFALGAAGTQLGTAYLLCPEAATPPLYRDALRHARGDATLMTTPDMCKRFATQFWL
jgi:NAD(P)H-dependent flavin oxidoreductase YrpB (nitropropane dioxygenase family)